MHRRKEPFASISILLKEMHRGLWVKDFLKRNEKAHVDKIEVGRK
jgi:hypothetical protein